MGEGSGGDGVRAPGPYGQPSALLRILADFPNLRVAVRQPVPRCVAACLPRDPRGGIHPAGTSPRSPCAPIPAASARYAASRTCPARPNSGPVSAASAAGGRMARLPTKSVVWCGRAVAGPEPITTTMTSFLPRAASPASHHGEAGICFRGDVHLSWRRAAKAETKRKGWREGALAAGSKHSPIIAAIAAVRVHFARHRDARLP